MTTYRPIGARVVSYGVAIVLIVVSAAIAIALPDNIVFTGSQIATLGLILLGILTALHGIGRSYVRADDVGLDILNGYRRHQVAWSEIRAIAMKRGAPWPSLILKGPDERHIILFAIQGSDGDAASRAVAELVRRLP